jgi:periplasmic protein TonB
MSVSTSTAILFQHDAQHRALFVCVGLSIALHALVLFAFPDLRPSARASSFKVLTAHFSQKLTLPESAPAAEEAPTPPPEPPPQEVKPETPRPVIAKPVPTAPTIPQKAVLAPVPEPSPPAPSPAQQTPAVARAQEPQAPGSQADAPAKASSEVSADAATLRQFLIALVDAANLYKRYPPQAREKGWAGRVEIRLVIGANGMIKSAVIKTSSNYQILDDQALDMVRKGKPRVQIPQGLRGREFTVDVPVIFELQTG